MGKRAKFKSPSGFITYDQAATQIRAALKRRSGKAWSVTTSRGTGYGWLRIVSPLARRSQMPFHMTEADRVELRDLLNIPDGQCNGQGVSVPPSEEFYHEFIDRAEGNEPMIFGEREHS